MDRRPNRHITQRGNNSWENVMSNLALENGLGETSTRPSSYTESTKASRDLLYISGRVNKLDSELLDEEVNNILQEPLYESFKHFDPRILNRYKPEISAALQAMLFYLSFSSGKNATYGQEIQNLTYSKGSKVVKKKLYLYAMTLVGGAYLWEKLSSHVSDNRWAEYSRGTLKNYIWRQIQNIEKIYRAATLLNFLMFISNGKYKSVLERIFGLKLRYGRPQYLQNISFEFMNRQMVWHAFTEFLMFITPLVNFEKLKSNAKITVRRLMGLPSVYTEPDVEALDESVCAICYVNEKKEKQSIPGFIPTEPFEKSSTVIRPYITNCSHIYCYICIKAKMMNEGGSTFCLRCGSSITAIKAL